MFLGFTSEMKIPISIFISISIRFTDENSDLCQMLLCFTSNNGDGDEYE